MLQTTLLDPQGKSSIFAHAFYRETIAILKNSDATKDQHNPLTAKELSKLFFDKSNITNFLNTYDIEFKDLSILMRAFTHSSYVHESTLEIKSYERLEFLGDSILGAYVTSNLFKFFEDMNEGSLSKFRSALVNEESLSELATFLGLEKYIILGKGELDQEINTGIQCDLFESILGAIAIDQGVDRAYRYLDQVIQSFEKESNGKFFDEARLVNFDPKSKLQEETLARFKVLPQYVATKIGEEFKIELIVKGEKLLSIVSKSKKQGTRDIARDCLKKELLNNI